MGHRTTPPPDPRKVDEDDIEPDDPAPGEADQAVLKQAVDQAKAIIAALPLKQAGEIMLAVTEAMLAKVNKYSPIGSKLMKLETHAHGNTPDHITVAFARGKEATNLTAAYDALKRAMGIE